MGFEPVLYAIPFFVILIALELYVNIKENKGWYDAKDAAASISMGLGSLVINIGVKAAYVLLYTWIYNNYRLFDLGSHWWVWILLFFADDFSFYWHHRLSHEIRILWAAHENHHSSMHYNLATALRQSWTELLYKYAFWLWLPLLGFAPWMILVQMSFSLIYQFWVHTEGIRTLGPMEWVFSTPSAHRVHHANNVQYLDRNHGGILIIWDRLFGTYQKELPEEPVKYGLTKNVESYNPLVIATHEYVNIAKDVKRAPGFWNKLKYFFMPPGWSYDGSTMTAKELRASLKKQK
jgi:sterol desaturase/sphingolipid hydroxylase (fatty acid hydroxylase superfamily)